MKPHPHWLFRARLAHERFNRDAEVRPTTGTYHVVCHECPFEHVEDMEGEARLAVDFHRGSTGRGDAEPHNVEYARIDT